MFTGPTPSSGTGLITDELRAGGLAVIESRIQGLCSDHGIFSQFGDGRRGGGKRPGPPVHDDLVRRDFTVASPNQVWLTDITEHPTAEGKLYLCAVKDVWSNRIVGYSMAARMTAGLCVNAVEHAVLLRGSVNAILHSDRGSQFRSEDFRQALNDNGPTGSMGRVGAAGDNAAVESWFGMLQNNFLDRNDWATRADLRAKIVYWTEAVYHRKRRQRRLGKLTPVEYETIHWPSTDHK
jgi:transposase InsO family protein